MWKLELIEWERWADSQVLFDPREWKILKHYFIPELWVNTYVEIQNQVANVLKDWYEVDLGYPLPIIDENKPIRKINVKVVNIKEPIIPWYVGNWLEHMRKKNEQNLNLLYSSYWVRFKPLQWWKRLISEVWYIPWNSLYDLNNNISWYVRDVVDPVQCLIIRVTDILEAKTGVCLSSPSWWFWWTNNSINPVNIKYEINWETIYLTVTDLAEKIGVFLKNNNLLKKP